MKYCLTLNKQKYSYIKYVNVYSKSICEKLKSTKYLKYRKRAQRLHENIIKQIL